jgi:uncharacterized membrane protein
MKSVSWRVVASLTTISLVLIFTGSLNLALEVGLFEVVAKLVLFFFHERVWNRLPWGRNLPDPVGSIV